MDNIKAMKHEFDATASSHPDMNLAVKLDQAYKDFMANHPSDSANAALLFNDALLNNHPLNKPDQAVEQLKKLVGLYPDSRYAPQALLMLGFLYETELHNPKLAKESYQMLIDKYPQHPLANDARASIQYMGKDLNTLFKEKEDSLKK